MTEKYVGVKGVAAWCGVTQAAVSQWIIRFPGKYPRERGTIGELDMINEEGQVVPERAHPAMGWLPEDREAWLRFAATAGYREFLPDNEEVPA